MLWMSPEQRDQIVEQRQQIDRLSISTLKTDQQGREIVCVAQLVDRNRCHVQQEVSGLRLPCPKRRALRQVDQGLHVGGCLPALIAIVQHDREYRGKHAVQRYAAFLDELLPE